MNIKHACLAVGAAVILLGGAMGTVRYVSAQEGGSSPPPADTQGQPPKFVEDYVGHLAGNLGISVDELKQASRTAAGQTVDDAVAQGKLTQEQGDKIKERISNSQGFGIGGFVGRIGKHGRDGRGLERLRKLREGLVNSVAAALNMSADDLKTELKAGKSVADVAGEKGVSLDTVKARITADATAKLNDAVSNGKLTQAQADKALQKLSDNLDNVLNKKHQPERDP